MPAYVDTGLNFVAVEDVAKGHWLAAERGEVGARYILGDRNLTLKQMLEILSALSGRPMPRLRLPHAVPYLAALADSLASRLLGRPPRIPLEGVRLARHKMFVDSSKATRELGFQPGPLEAPWSAPFAGTVKMVTSKRPLRGGRRVRMRHEKAPLHVGLHRKVQPEIMMTKSWCLCPEGGICSLAAQASLSPGLRFPAHPFCDFFRLHRSVCGARRSGRARRSPFQ